MRRLPAVVQVAQHSEEAAVVVGVVHMPHVPCPAPGVYRDHGLRMLDDVSQLGDTRCAHLDEFVHAPDERRQGGQPRVCRLNVRHHVAAYRTRRVARAVSIAAAGDTSRFKACRGAKRVQSHHLAHERRREWLAEEGRQTAKAVIKKRAG